MISKSRLCVNTVIHFSAVLVLCTGITYPKNLLADTTSSSSAKAQLHLPWNLLSERLKTLVNSEANGVAQPIEAQTITANGINFDLNSGTALATLRVDRARVSESEVNVALNDAKLEVTLNELKVDQLIERVVGGVRVRVRLNAVCGPIVVQQPQAKVAANFKLDWTSGSPAAALSELLLSWAPDSWTFNEFTCSGPSGLDEELREGIANYLKDPAAFKPNIEKYISENLKLQVDKILAQLREPLKVGSGSSAVKLTVGELAAVSTGVIADITLTRSGKSSPRSLPAKSLPDRSTLQSLSTSKPSLLGDIELIEFVIQQKLRSQGEYYKMNLQEVAGFRKLMGSRIAQIFAWYDLTHYPKKNPFYLNLANPKSLDLRKGTGSTLTSTVPIYAVTQSYRDKKWWSWVITKGSANTSVALQLSNGRLKYTTEIQSATLKSSYGPEYAKEYDKDKGNKIPDKIFAEAIAGPQSALSGEYRFPDVDLAEGGEYRASELDWIGSKSFRLTFSRLR